jgi:hypothetical protein
MRSSVGGPKAIGIQKVEIPSIPGRVVWHSTSTNSGKDDTEAWHQLPQQEQQRLLSLVMEALNTAGGKELVICSAAWANERWPFFGVKEFPDVEAYNASNRS